MNYLFVGIYSLVVFSYVGGSSALLMHSPPEPEPPHPENEQSYDTRDYRAGVFVQSGSVVSFTSAAGSKFVLPL